MKRTLGVFLGLGIVIGLGYIAVTTSSTTTVTKEPMSQPASIADEVKLTAAELLEQATQEMIDEAITASSTEIEAAKAEAAQRVEKDMHLKIERSVRLQMADSNDGALEVIEKELSF